MTEGAYWASRFEHYDNQARGLQQKAYELVAIGLTTVAALSGVAISYSRYEVFAFVPIICVLLWAIAGRMIHEHLLLSAYRDFAEAQAANLATTSSSSFGRWRKQGGKLAMRGPANYYVFGVVIAITVGLTFGSLGFLFTTNAVPLGWLIAETITVGIGLIAGAVVFVTASSDHRSLEKQMDVDLSQISP